MLKSGWSAERRLAQVAPPTVLPVPGGELRHGESIDGTDHGDGDDGPV